jgi:uncharacterized integral membrane protein
LYLRVSETVTDILEVLIASIIRAIIILMMEAVGTTETIVNFYETTKYNIPAGCHLHACWP